jgi:radical SAM protein with 4Fe4S-binding SPASM domain
VGKDTVIVTPDGIVSSCYLMPERWEKKNLNLEIGLIGQNGSVSIDTDRVKQIRRMCEEKPRCRKCFCQWSCAGGCHVDNSWPGCEAHYSDFCRQTRLISFATLLENLELDDEIDGLFDKPAFIRLVTGQKSDRLSDWSCNE